MQATATAVNTVAVVVHSVLCYISSSYAEWDETRLTISALKKMNNNMINVGGQHSPTVAYLLPHPPAPGSIPSIPEIVNVAEVNQWCCLKESGEWLDNVNWTHLVLASGKLELQCNQWIKFSPLRYLPCYNNLKSQRVIFGPMQGLGLSRIKFLPVDVEEARWT